MEVTVEEYVATFKRALHHELCVVVDRVEFRRCSNPLTVEIVAHKRAPIVTNDDTVRVQHRHDLEYESAPQELGMLIVADQEVYDAIHEPGCVRFARMHS